MRVSSRILIPLLVFQIVLFLSGKPIYSQNSVFTNETSERLPQIIDTSHYAEYGDIDGDNDIDIFISNTDYGGSNIPNLILLNNGGGYFYRDSTGMLPHILTTYINRMTLGDIESDGDLDIFVAVDEDWNLLLVNDGLGYFVDESDERLPDKIVPWRSTDAMFGDVDKDMDLDFIVSNYGNDKNLLRLNDGIGYFVGANDQFPSGSDNSTSVVGADVDADSDIDVYVANDLFGDGDKLMINAGNGFFWDASGIQIPQDNNATNGAAFGDVDLDGDLDLVIANYFFASNRIFINSGNGYFDDRSGDLLPWDSAESGSASFGDIDNDGDLDLLIANHASGGTLNQLYTNNGSGRFTDETSKYLPVEESETDILLLGDVDSDGDLDIFEVNHSTTDGKQNRLLINNSTPDSFPPIIPRTFNHPDTGDTTNPYLITSTVWDNISIVVGELKISLFYRAFSDTSRNSSEVEFTEIPMIDCGGFLYREQILSQQSGTIVEYYIKAEDRMGNVSYDPPNAPDSAFSFLVDVSVGVSDAPPSSPPLPKTFSLSQNYPNPFNPSTTIDYSIPEGERVQTRLKIFNIRGKLIRILFDIERGPGQYSAHWDGRDQKGEVVGSGVYLYRIEAGEFTSLKKMILTR